MHAIPLAYVGLAKIERTTDLERFVRWEYAPADRTHVILSARGGVVLIPRRAPKRPRRGLGMKLRALAAAVRRSSRSESLDG